MLIFRGKVDAKRSTLRSILPIPYQIIQVPCGLDHPTPPRPPLPGGLLLGALGGSQSLCARLVAIWVGLWVLWEALSRSVRVWWLSG